MTPHDRIRHDQSLVLRDSLLGSSFSFLTVAVAVLLVATFHTAPVVDGLDPFEIVEFPPRDLKNYSPIPSGGGSMAIEVPPTSIDGRLIPVEDQLLRDAPPLAPPEIAEFPVTIPGEGTGTAGPGGKGGLEGSTGPAHVVIPDPGVWTFHDVPPVLATKVTPEYPELARQARMEGRLVVRAFVGPDGRVLRAEAESGPAIFEDAATDAVARWVFTPALADGHPVGVWVRVPVVFRLD